MSRFFSLKAVTNKRSCDIQPVVIKKKDIFKVFIVEHVSFKSIFIIFILVAFSEKIFIYRIKLMCIIIGKGMLRKNERTLKVI